MFSTSMRFAGSSANRAARGQKSISGYVHPVAALCLVLLVSGSVLGQSSPGNSALASIHGKLTTTQDGAATALAGIPVKLSPEGAGAIPETADTDEAGQYQFKNLKPGPYTVSVGLAGFKPFAKAVQVEPG